MLIASCALIIGMLIGSAAVLAYVASNTRRREAVENVAEPTVAEGTTEVLSLVGRAYVILDSVNGVVKANPSAYAYGLIRGHSLIHDELIRVTERVRRDGVIEEAQFELPRTPMGPSTIVVHVRVAPLSRNYILLLADDRTEAVRVEAIRNDFVANVSHELKTPVGAISLMAEALEGSAGDRDAVEHFSRRLTKETARLAALIQDIIDLSRLQSKDIVGTGGPVSIKAVLTEAVDRTQLAAEAKEIAIVANIPEGITVQGDQEQITMGLKNLIDNAVRYSPEKTKVGIGVKRADGVVSISVADQGPGISEEDQERIFERFYRVDSARSRQTGGTGLGLSIVKHVFENHGGQVSVWSQEGQGSTFTVKLPELDERSADGTTAAKEH